MKTINDTEDHLDRVRDSSKALHHPIHELIGYRPHPKLPAEETWWPAHTYVLGGAPTPAEIDSADTPTESLEAGAVTAFAARFLRWERVSL